MDPAISHFLSLELLVAAAQSDPVNVGWYLAKAYWLGRGESVDFVLASPPAKDTGLRLVS